MTQTNKLQELDMLRRECEQLRIQLAQCMSSCTSLETIKELLAIIRTLEDKVEALVNENSQLRRKLEECKEAGKN